MSTADGVELFRHTLATLAYRAGKAVRGAPASYVGQLTMLRRLAGAPVRGENYFIADIQTGRVGPDQAPPKKEFG
jgi:hypothetical protein